MDCRGLKVKYVKRVGGENNQISPWKSSINWKAYGTSWV